MESEFEYMLSQKNILERYEYLKSIMKHYKVTYDKNSLTMKELLVDITKIIKPLAGNSNEKDVKEVDLFFRILVKNSIRLDKNSIEFKVLSHFIQKGFDLFVNILKAKKVTTLKEYVSLLLDFLIEKKEILKKFNLTNQVVENCLNLTEFVNVMQSKSMKSKKNILFFFVLLFFSKFVKENDQIIYEEIKNYLKENEIKKFYKKLEKEKLKKEECNENKKSEDKKEECNENKKSEDKKEECNENKNNEDKKEECNENKNNEDKKKECNDELENKNNINEIVIEEKEKEKKDIVDDFSNHLMQNTDDSSTVEKKKSGSDSESNNSSSSQNKDSILEEKVIHLKDNNQYNNNEVLCMIQKLSEEIEKLRESSRKEIEDLKRKEELSKNERESSKKEIEDLKRKEELSKNERESSRKEIESSKKEIEDLKRKEELSKNERESSRKEIEDLKRKEELSKKEIEDLKRNVDLLNNNNKELREQVKSLDKKLSLSLLINSLSSQRDTYKKALELLLKHVISEYKLEITLTEGEPLWKYTKEVSGQISELNKKEKNEKNKKLVEGLLSLLFCKDYANCIVHGKGKLTEEIKKSYKEKDVIPFISVASYENMKTVTLQFFGNTVNQLEDFKFINSILREKTKNWKDLNDFNYSRYLTENGIEDKVIIEDFNSIIKIMEDSDLSKKVDIELEK